MLHWSGGPHYLPKQRPRVLIKATLMIYKGPAGIKNKPKGVYVCVCALTGPALLCIGPWAPGPWPGLRALAPRGVIFDSGPPRFPCEGRQHDWRRSLELLLDILSAIPAR